MKYLLVLLVVIAGLWLLSVQRRRERAAAQQRRREAPNPTGGQARPTPPADPPLPQMVRCAHCGVHLPLPEAVQSGALPYCSPQHATAGPARPG